MFMACRPASVPCRRGMPVAAGLICGLYKSHTLHNNQAKVAILFVFRKFEPLFYIKKPIKSLINPLNAFILRDFCNLGLRRPGCVAAFRTVV